MEHKRFWLFSLAAVLLLLSSELAVAQIGLQQQMPNYQTGSPSAAAVNRSRAESPSELRIVPEDFAKLKLAPGFLVSLNVLDDSDFVGSFRIDEQGDITVPILGAVRIAGKTAGEASDNIKNRLVAEQILNNPQVTVTILEYATPDVTIVGEVTSPGKYPLLAPRRLVEVLALAGGPTLIAGNEVRIIPGNTSSESVIVHYSRTANPKDVEDVIVRPGDTVQVKRAGIVYVLGAVNRPGGYVMQEDGTLNVMQAISLASGTSVSASTGTIYLFRRNEDGTGLEMELRYKKITQGKYADLQLHPADVLYVPTSTMKSILTNSQGILASAASASIYAVAVY